MAKKGWTLKQIRGVQKSLEDSGFEIVRGLNGTLYTVTRSKANGTAVQEYAPANRCQVAKWILRGVDANHPQGLIAEAVEFMALEAGKKAPVPIYQRVAERKGELFVDLCNGTGEVARITADGWELVKDCPVYFLRPHSAQPLPTPTRKGKGSVEKLREALNIRDEETWVLLLGWLCAAMKDQGGHLILVFQGPPGSAKSTFTKFLAWVLDPRTPQTLQMPQKGDDVHLITNNRLIVALDEVDDLTQSKAALIAAIATGGGLEKKKNYADTEVVSVSVCRPLILNGHGDLTREERILDRAVPVTLARIDSDDRLSDSELTKRFLGVWSDVLGGLFDLASAALRNPPSGPCAIRMTEAGSWADRCLTAAGYPVGAFSQAVKAAQDRVATEAVEEWLLLAPLLKLAAESFSGRPTDLLNALNALPGAPTRDPSWPKTAVQLSKQLKAHVADLQGRGVIAEHAKGENRVWTIRRESCPSKAEAVADLKPLPAAEVERMKSRFESLASVAEQVTVACMHDDGSFTLYGVAATTTAAKLNRTPETGPSLRITKGQWMGGGWGERVMIRVSV